MLRHGGPEAADLASHSVLNTNKRYNKKNIYTYMNTIYIFAGSKKLFSKS